MPHSVAQQRSERDSVAQHRSLCKLQGSSGVDALHGEQEVEQVGKGIKSQVSKKNTSLQGIRVYRKEAYRV